MPPPVPRRRPLSRPCWPNAKPPKRPSSPRSTKRSDTSLKARAWNCDKRGFIGYLRGNRNGRAARLQTAPLAASSLSRRPLNQDSSLPIDGLKQPQRFWAMVTTGIGVFVTVVASSVVNVALPTIAADMKVDASATVWVVNAYQIAIMLALLPLASLGDIFGYRRVYLGGLALFSVASLACALAPS